MKPKKKIMKKIGRTILWILVILIFIGTFFFLYKNSQTPEDSFETLAPEITDISRTTVLTGKIEPRDEISVKPQISGIISEINVEAGEFVHEGDVIAHIKVIPDASSLSSAQSRIDNARIEVNDALAKLERTRILYEKKVVSREELENAQKTYDKANKELEYANDSYRIIKEGVSQYNAKESNTLVRATITGLVLDVPVKVGSSVIQANTMNDGTTVATIADMNNLIFKGNVDETEVGLLAIGMPMEITIGALPDIHPKATIEYISPKSTDTSGANTFEIKAAMEVDHGVTLRSGYSANATVTLAKSEQVLTVPEAAVVFEGDSTYVYVRTDTVPKPQFEKRAISTGLSDGIKVEVKKGVEKTDVLRGNKIIASN